MAISFDEQVAATTVPFYNQKKIYIPMKQALNDWAMKTYGRKVDISSDESNMTAHDTAKRSLHGDGRAIDISVKGITNKQLFRDLDHAIATGQISVPYHAAGGKPFDSGAFNLIYYGEEGERVHLGISRANKFIGSEKAIKRMDASPDTALADLDLTGPFDIYQSAKDEKGHYRTLRTKVNMKPPGGKLDQPSGESTQEAKPEEPGIWDKVKGHIRKEKQYYDKVWNNNESDYDFDDSTEGLATYTLPSRQPSGQRTVRPTIGLQKPVAASRPKTQAANKPKERVVPFQQKPTKPMAQTKPIKQKPAHTTKAPVMAKNKLLAVAKSFSNLVPSVEIVPGLGELKIPIDTMVKALKDKNKAGIPYTDLSNGIIKASLITPEYTRGDMKLKFKPDVCVGDKPEIKYDRYNDNVHVNPTPIFRSHPDGTLDLRNAVKIIADAMSRFANGFYLTDEDKLALSAVFPKFKGEVPYKVSNARLGLKDGDINDLKHAVELFLLDLRATQNLGVGDSPVSQVSIFRDAQ